MNLKHLVSFVEVANYGSFSLAAEHLNTVQSAVSRHINALEQDLGVTLLQRSTRHVELTEAGKAFFRDAEAILRQCSQARQHARDIASGRRGVLRIGYMSSACAHFLPAMLRQFSAYADNVDIQIFEMTAAEQIEGFLSGTIDLGFSRPMNAHLAPRICSRHLLDDPIVSVLSDTHPLAGEPSLSLSQIADQPLTLFARGHAPSLFDTLISGFFKRELQPRVVNEPANMQALLTQVSSGHSVALVPSCVANLQTNGCRFVPLRESMHVPLEMHWPQNTKPLTDIWLGWFAEQTFHLSASPLTAESEVARTY